MARDLAAVESFCIVSDAERSALLSPRRPIVVLRRRPDANISPAVAPGNNTIGVMLPYTPLHYLLFSDSPDDPPQFTALVMTSGNISEEPIVTSNEEAWQRLQPVADWFVFHNRDIYMRADDSVVRTFEGRERVLRRSRGYVPHPVDLGVPLSEILACGAELKNTFCLTKGRYAILSQHIGDLENYETLVFFEETLANLKKLFRVEPRAVAYDLHPQYMSTQFALEIAAGAKDRGAASSRAHRQLHGGEPSARQGHRRGLRRNRLRHRRRRSGAGNFWSPISRDSSGARICAMFRWRAAMRRCASPGAWRSVICATRSVRAALPDSAVPAQDSGKASRRWSTPCSRAASTVLRPLPAAVCSMRWPP